MVTKPYPPFKPEKSCGPDQVFKGENFQANFFSKQIKKQTWKFPNDSQILEQILEQILSASLLLICLESVLALLVPSRTSSDNV